MSLWIKVCHHSPSLVMSNGNPQTDFLSYPHTHDRFVYHTLPPTSWICLAKYPISSFEELIFSKEGAI